MKKNIIQYVSLLLFILSICSCGTGVEPQPTPNKITLLKPVNNAQDQLTSLSLNWQRDANANMYHIQVSKSSDLSSPIVDKNNHNAASYSIDNMVNDTVYYWRVRGINVNAEGSRTQGPWSDTWSFATVSVVNPPTTVNPPDKPTLTSPADNAPNQPIMLTLEWNTVPTATTYDVQLSTNSNLSSPIVDTTISTSSYVINTPLTSATQYYWRVRAGNSDGKSDWSNGSFTTVAVVNPPTKPVLTSPANNAPNQPVMLTLTWNVLSTAATYDLQLSKNSDLSSPILDTTISTSSYAVNTPLTLSTQYYWRVRGGNSAGKGDWSTTWSFTTTAVSPALSARTSQVRVAILSVLNLSNEIDVTATLLATIDSLDLASKNITALKAGDFSNLTGLERLKLNNNPLSNLPNAIFSPLTSLTDLVLPNALQNVSATVKNGWSIPAQATVTYIDLPGEPTLLSPIDLSANQSLQLTFRWNAVSQATRYQIQISTTSSFTTMTHDEVVTNTFYAVSSGLTVGTSYYWRVRAANEAGMGDWSYVLSFTTLSAPTIPSLDSPIDNAQDQSRTLTLTWQTVHNATTYDIQLSTTNAFNSFVVDTMVSTSSYTVTDSLAIATTYHWRVRSGNEVGKSAWSTTRSFMTIAPPAVPVLILPIDNAQNRPLTQTLSWQTISSATGYALQVSTSNSFNSFVVNITTTTASYQVSSLQPGTPYYWRVRATNNVGQSAWSSVRSFTTVSIPTQPTLSSPADSAQNQPSNALTVTWANVSTATAYDVQVSTSSAFSSFVVNTTTTTASYQVPSLQQGTLYYWRVRASNSAGSSPWSDTRSFMTRTSTVNAPTLLMPTNASTDLSVNIISFSWSSTVANPTYMLQVADNMAFTSPIIDINTSSSATYTTSAPVYSDIGTDIGTFTFGDGTTYYWRVAVEDGASSDVSPWTTPFSFTTKRTLFYGRSEPVKRRLISVLFVVNVGLTSQDAVQIENIQSYHFENVLELDLAYDDKPYNLSTYDLKNLINMTNFSIFRDSGIEMIEDSTVFADNTKLLSITINETKLSALPSGLFRPLSKLTRLSFPNNGLTALSSNMFTGLVALTELQLFNNKIASIEAGSFEGLPQLSTLSLNDNPFTALPNDVFKGLTNLSVLSLPAGLEGSTSTETEANHQRWGIANTVTVLYGERAFSPDD